MFDDYISNLTDEVEKMTIKSTKMAGARPKSIVNKKREALKKLIEKHSDTASIFSHLSIDDYENKSLYDPISLQCCCGLSKQEYKTFTTH